MSFNVKSLFSILDAYLSTSVGTIIAIGFLLGSGMLVFHTWEAHSWYLFILCSIFFLWCLITEIGYLFTAWMIVLSHEQPYALLLAYLQPPIPKVIQIPLALWWLFHFSYAVVFSMMLVWIEIGIPVFGSLIAAITVTSFTYLAYSFLLLSITVFSKKPSLIEKLWSWRMVWSLAHGLCLLCVKLCMTFH